MRITENDLKRNLEYWIKINIKAKKNIKICYVVTYFNQFYKLLVLIQTAHFYLFLQNKFLTHY